jgi:hypothetical protein
MSTSAPGTRSPPRILSRMVRLLAGLMALNTATKKQFAISLRNYGTADRELLVTGIGLVSCPDESARSCRARHGDALPGRDLDRSQTGVPARALKAAASDSSAQPSSRPLRTGVVGVQHVLEMGRRTLPAGATRSSREAATGSQKSQRQRASGPTESPASAEIGGQSASSDRNQGASRTSKQDLN